MTCGVQRTASRQLIAAWCNVNKRNFDELRSDPQQIQQVWRLALPLMLESSSLSDAENEHERTLLDKGAGAALQHAQPFHANNSNMI